MFCKKDVLKNFSNFTGKQLYWSLFLIKLQANRPASLIKRDSNTGAFLSNLRNFYFEEHLRMAAFSSSSLELDLAHLTVFPELNLRPK